MTTLQEKIAVMQAFADGREIESTRSGSAWGVNTSPVWNWLECEYRVKREPREWWVNVYPEESSSIAHLSRTAADCDATRTRTECIHVREVID